MSQHTLSWALLLPSPLPDPTYQEHGMVYALSATSQPEVYVSLDSPVSAVTVSFSNPSPSYFHSSSHHHPDWTILPTSFGLWSHFLRSTRLTYLPNKTDWVTAQLRYPILDKLHPPLGSIQGLLRRGLSPASGLTSHPKYQHSMPMNHICPRT